MSKRIVNYKPKDLKEEVLFRIKLEECEKFNTPFILNQIKKYMNKVDPETELFKRIILMECEKHTTEWVERTLNYPQQTFKDDEHQDLYEQLKYREDLEQCEIKE